MDVQRQRENSICTTTGGDVASEPGNVVLQPSDLSVRVLITCMVTPYPRHWAPVDVKASNNRTTAAGRLEREN